MKKICVLIVIASFLFFGSGCALISAAASAAAVYGIYKATQK